MCSHVFCQDLLYLERSRATLRSVLVAPRFQQCIRAAPSCTCTRALFLCADYWRTTPIWNVSRRGEQDISTVLGNRKQCRREVLLGYCAMRWLTGCVPFSAGRSEQAPSFAPVYGSPDGCTPLCSSGHRCFPGCVKFDI